MRVLTLKFSHTPRETTKVDHIKRLSVSCLSMLTLDIDMYISCCLWYYRCVILILDSVESVYLLYQVVSLFIHSR